MSTDLIPRNKTKNKDLIIEEVKKIQPTRIDIKAIFENKTASVDPKLVLKDPK